MFFSCQLCLCKSNELWSEFRNFKLQNLLTCSFQPAA